GDGRQNAARTFRTEIDEPGPPRGDFVIDGRVQIQQSRCQNGRACDGEGRNDPEARSERDAQSKGGFGQSAAAGGASGLWHCTLNAPWEWLFLLGSCGGIRRGSRRIRSGIAAGTRAGNGAS